MDLKILQIGAGSMGTRRLRDLGRRSEVKLAVYDQRPDRLQAAQSRFNVPGFSTLEEALAWEPAALVISTPPGAKGPYVDLAFERGLHHFAEADPWTYGAARRSRENPRLVAAPSASLGFLPLVQEIKALRPELGSILGYELALGTYMPSWHAGEGPEYYARHRDTNPAREMAVFELIWLDTVFGAAVEVAGAYQKSGELPGGSEDTWSLLTRLESGATAQIISTMACPEDYLRGVCLGSRGFLTWDVMTGDLCLQAGGKKIERNLGPIATAKDVNYLGEMNGFVDAILGRRPWPQTYGMSQRVSATLAAAEKSALTGQWVKVDPEAEPEMSLPRRG